MKNAIITIALVLLASILIVCQLDINQMERQGYMVKHAADQVANAAGVSIDLNEYSKGYIIFNYDRANALAKEVFCENLGYLENYTPNNDYFYEPAKVHVFYFDQSMTAKYYLNGVWQRDFEFDFGKNFSVYSNLGNDFKISMPCVCVIIDAGKPRIRLSFALGQGRISKSSVYEYVY